MKIVKKVFGFLFIFFPFFIYGLEKYNAPDYFKFIILGFALLLMLLNRENNFWLIAVICVISVAAVSLVKHENIVRVYPFLMSTSALTFFIVSHKKGNSALVFYSSKFVNMTQEKTAYLNKASILWILGLSVNSLIFFVLLFSFSLKTWLIYSGILSYIFLALLFLITVCGGFIYERR